MENNNWLNYFYPQKSPQEVHDYFSNPDLIKQMIEASINAPGIQIAQKTIPKLGNIIKDELYNYIHPSELQALQKSQQEYFNPNLLQRSGNISDINLPIHGANLYSGFSGYGQRVPAYNKPEFDYNLLDEYFGLDPRLHENINVIPFRTNPQNVIPLRPK